MFALLFPAMFQCTIYAAHWTISYVTCIPHALLCLQLIPLLLYLPP